MLELLVKLGAAAPLTTSVNVCDAEPPLLSAPKEMVYVPLTGLLAASVPVPLPLSVKVAQVGKPLAESAGVGIVPAEVVTVNESGDPGGTVSMVALVIVGACATWMVKVFLVVVFGPLPVL